MTTKNTHIIEARAKGFDKAKGKVKGVSSSLKGMAKAAIAVAAAMQGARMVLSSMKTLIELAGKQELAERKLTAALGKRSFALQQQAKSLQQVSRFGDEAILEAQAMIASFIKEEDAVAAATKATLDLAAAKGMDLVAAADLVSKTLGSSTNALSRYGIAVEGAVGSTERLESMTSAIAGVFGGQAAAQADTYQGKMDALSNAAGDLGESIGTLLLPAVTAVTEGLKIGVDTINNWLGTGLQKQLKNEAAEFDVLTQMLVQYNDDLNMRSTIIEKLQTTHPDFLKALGDEIDDTEKIVELADEYNTALQLRQQLMLAEEVSSRAAAKYADETFEVVENLAKLQVRVQDAYEKTGMSSEEAAEKTKKMFTEGLTQDVGRNAEMVLQRIMDATKENSDLSDELFGKWENLRFTLLTTPIGAGIIFYEIAQALNENEESLSGFAKILYDLSEANIDAEFQTWQNSIEQVNFAQNDLNNSTYTGNQFLSETIAKKKELSLFDMGVFDPIEPLKKEYDARNRINEVINKQITLQQMLMEITAEQHAAGIEASHETAIANIHMALSEAKAGLIAKIMSGVPFPLNLVAAAGADKLINKAFSKAGIRMAATGADYIAEQPELLMVGESNRERVQVTPLEDVNLEGGTSGITLNISGNVLHDSFVEEQIIPSIKEGLRRGGSIA